MTKEISLLTCPFCGAIKPEYHLDGDNVSCKRCQAPANLRRAIGTLDTAWDKRSAR